MFITAAFITAPGFANDYLLVVSLHGLFSVPTHLLFLCVWICSFYRDIGQIRAHANGLILT